MQFHTNLSQVCAPHFRPSTRVLHACAVPVFLCTQAGRPQLAILTTHGHPYHIIQSLYEDNNTATREMTQGGSGGSSSSRTLVCNVAN